MGGPQGGIQVKFVIWGYPYFRKCLFIWSEESPVAQLRIGFSQPHHRVLIFFQIEPEPWGDSPIVCDLPTCSGKSISTWLWVASNQHRP